MDSTSGAEPGQSRAVREATVQEIGLLCELVQYIRAWWEAFQATIQQLDKAASRKAHDAFVDAVILARRIARELGVKLPDYATVDWAVTPVPASRPSGQDL